GASPRVPVHDFGVYCHFAWGFDRLSYHRAAAQRGSLSSVSAIFVAVVQPPDITILLAAQRFRSLTISWAAFGGMPRHLFLRLHTAVVAPLKSNQAMKGTIPGNRR